MGRVNTPILSAVSHQELENGYRTGKNHAYRVRCQTILLKSEGRKSKDVGNIVGMSHVSVNSWLSRYKLYGINGLLTKAGRGRKPKIDKCEDTEAVLEAVKSNRQRLQTAKASWEENSGKSVSRNTFRSFLKVLADDIKE
jgi:transposase